MHPNSLVQNGVLFPTTSLLMPQRLDRVQPGGLDTYINDGFGRLLTDGRRPGYTVRVARRIGVRAQFGDALFTNSTGVAPNWDPTPILLPHRVHQPAASAIG